MIDKLLKQAAKLAKTIGKAYFEIGDLVVQAETISRKTAAQTRREFASATGFTSDWIDNCKRIARRFPPSHPIRLEKGISFTHVRALYPITSDEEVANWIEYINKYKPSVEALRDALDRRVGDIRTEIECRCDHCGDPIQDYTRRHTHKAGTDPLRQYCSRPPR